MREPVSPHGSFLTDWKSLTEVDKWSTNLLFSLGLIGYSLCSTWSLLLYYSPAPITATASGQSLQQLCRITFLSFLTLTFVVIWLLSKRMTSKKRATIFSVIPFAIAIITCAILLVPKVGAPFVIIAWGISGIGYACLVLNWVHFLGSMDRGRLDLYAITTTIISGTLYIIVSYMQYTPLIIAISVIAMLSASLCGFLSGKLPAIPVSRDTPKKARALIAGKPFLSSLIYSIAMGLAGSSAIGFVSAYGALFIGMSIVAAGFFIAFASRRFGKNLKPLMARWTIPFITLTILPMPFVNAPGRFACSCVLLAACFCRSIVNRQAQVLVVSRSGYSLGAFSYGRLANVIGALIGWVLGYLAFSGAARTNEMAVVIIISTAALFVVFGTFIISDYFPAQQEPKDGKGRCEQIAEQFGLSERQLEVMTLLAKGRDTEYITEALVLSNHTVRTHIYAIYKKLNVHSKQELLDIIEGEQAKE